MAAVKGRTHRTGVANTVPLKGRVQRENKDKVEKIAEALGISAAAYLDALIAQERVDAEGRPLWWTEPTPADQQELPLPLADTA